MKFKCVNCIFSFLFFISIFVVIYRKLFIIFYLGVIGFFWVGGFDIGYWDVLG